MTFSSRTALKKQGTSSIGWDNRGFKVLLMA